jgi:hypothetical protein
MAILDQCLTETTTLGVRWHTFNRATLARDENSHPLQGEPVRVKRAERPDGVRTRKVEMADLAATPGGHAGREQLTAGGRRPRPGRTMTSRPQIRGQVSERSV